jgi:hypothetical protein
MRPLEILMVFDTHLRSDTTGVYALRALGELGHRVSHHEPLRRDASGSLTPSGYGALELGRFDFLLFVDDDVDHPVPVTSCPKYYWCIDTHRMDEMTGPGTRFERITRFERTFFAQRDRARELGGPWLPLAHDPAVYHPLELPKLYDWCFIGNLSPRRAALCAELRSEFPGCFVGNAYGEDANRIYNQSRLALNVTLANDVNMRFFEAQATSALMLTNPCENGELELFGALELWNDGAECKALMRRWLAAPAELARRVTQQLAAASRHSYRARMEELLASVVRAA